MNLKSSTLAVLLASWSATSLGCIVQEDPNFMGGEAGDTGTSTDTQTTGTGTGTGTSDTDTGTGTTDTGTTDTGTTETGTTETSTTGPDPMSHHIFVTSTIHTGMLGGRTGADSICTARASGASLPGQWVALISTPDAHAKDAVMISGPVYNMDDEVIANDAADLWDGDIATSFRIDENGQQSGLRAWTGTFADGTGSPDHCNDWSVQSGGFQGILGNAGATGSTWINDGNGGCAQSFHLFCVSVG